MTDKDKIIHDYFARLGLKGGKARAEALTPERRAEIGRLAVKKRWDEFAAKKKKKGGKKTQ